MTSPDGPQQWAADHRTVVIDDDPALTGTAWRYQAAYLVVQLADGGHTEVAPERVALATEDQADMRAVTALGGGRDGTRRLAALRAAGLEVTARQSSRPMTRRDLPA